MTILLPFLAALAAAGPGDIASTLQAAGYAEVREIEFDDGLWEAEVRRANGLWGEVAVDPSTGEVFDVQSPRALIALPAVLAALERAGYREIRDIERDGALWDAEALDPTGARVELHVSGYDGRVVSARPDGAD